MFVKKAEFENDGRKFFMLNFEPYKLIDITKQKMKVYNNWLLWTIIITVVWKSARFKYQFIKHQKI